MANQNGNINFTGQVDGTARTLTLTNTGVYNPGVSLYSWSVVNPSGAIRTATGQTAAIALPAATDGALQLGSYSITATVTDTDGTVSNLTRTVMLTLADVRPVVTVTENYTTPSAVFSDAATYAQPGYMVQSIIRAWRATQGSVVFTGSNSTTFDLGVLYRSEYTVKQAAVVTYQRTGATWLTLVNTYTYQQSYTPKIFPSLPTMLDWSGEEDCGCEEGNSADCLRKAVTDFYCNGNIEQAYRKVQQLFRETHDRAAYRPVLDGQALSGVAYCTATGLPLSITTQPVGGNLIGGVLQLAVVAAGGQAPYSYQWYGPGGTISGATAASYVATVAGSYYVIVTDAAGVTVTSATATVAVQTLQPPTLGTPLQSAGSIYVPLTPASQATGSVILLSPNSDFSGTPLQQTAANGEVEFTGLTANTTYYIKGYSIKTGSPNSADSGVQQVRTFNSKLTQSNPNMPSGSFGIAGQAGVEVHLDEVTTGAIPPPQINDVFVAGVNVVSLNFDSQYLNKNFAVVVGGVHKYKNTAGQRLATILDTTGSGSQINIS